MPDDEDTNANLASIFREIETTEELWFASFIIQLDVEARQLSLVLDHPLCDRELRPWFLGHSIRAVRIRRIFNETSPNFD